MNLKISIPLEYIVGHLRYGHIEGEMSEEVFKKYQKGEDIDLDDLEDYSIIVDDYEMDDYGEIEWDYLKVIL